MKQINGETTRKYDIKPKELAKALGLRKGEMVETIVGLGHFGETLGVQKIDGTGIQNKTIRFETIQKCKE